MPPKRDKEPEDNKGTRSRILDFHFLVCTNVDAQTFTAARFGRVRNNLKMGIVGLPNVGKSSTFNMLCEMSAPAENFPFCTIEPNESRVAVPDERYDYLCDLWNPPSKYPAYLQVVDIAGLVKGASEGAGLGNAFLSHIQAVDGIYHVVRAFEDDNVIHVDDSVDPVRDLDTIQNELCKKDMVFLEAAIAKEEKDVKCSPGFKLSPVFKETMAKVRELLENNKPVRDAEWSTPEVEMINLKLQGLITTKPVTYLINMSAEDFKRKKNKFLAKIHAWVQSHGGGCMIPFSVEWEQQLLNQPDEAAKKAFCDASGVQSAFPKIIKQGYADLNLRYFFTAGEKEVRCWTVFGGASAPQAAGVIHSDFERGFIKAEVVSYADFKELATSKGMAEVKAAGKYRQEGKSYEVQDGDIIHFQFNVTAQKKK